MSGTYTKKVGSKSALRLIAAPTIYGQLTFEEDGEFEISEWLVNYDIASSLITRNADEEEEAYASFDPDSDKTGNQVIEEIENTLEKLKTMETRFSQHQNKLFLDWRCVVLVSLIIRGRNLRASAALNPKRKYRVVRK